MKRAATYNNGPKYEPSHDQPVPLAQKWNIDEQHMMGWQKDPRNLPNWDKKADDRLLTRSTDSTDLKEVGVPTFMANIGYPSAPTEEPRVDLSCPMDYHDDFIEGSPLPTSPKTQFQECDYTKWPFPSQHLPHGKAYIYDTCKAANKLNHKGPRLKMDTSLRLEAWYKEATGHKDDSMVLDGIAFGFPLQFSGPPLYSDHRPANHPSATRHPDHVRRYLEQEVAHGSMAGPYESPPFTPWCVMSPLMSRLNKDSDSRRIILDLSYPEGGVNAHIKPHVYDGREACHYLPTIDNATRLITDTCTGDVHMAVINLSRAYRQLPVSPNDWPLLCFHFENVYYFDQRLPFTGRMSAYVMQNVADFIVRALETRRINAHMYLDDLVIIAKTRALAEQQYVNTIDLLETLGLEVAHNNLQPPAQRVMWLGIQFDLGTNEISIPCQKLDKIKLSMAAVSQRNTITKKHLQRIIGLANHLAKVVRAARVFIGRLLAALKSDTPDRIVMNKLMKADLRWFDTCVTNHNGKAIIPEQIVRKRIWADACLAGGGASDRNVYYAYVFPPALAVNHNTTQLEALNCLAAVRLMVTPDHAGGTIHIYCDNMPAVKAITSGRARDLVLAACARAIWAHAATTDTSFRFTHVPGAALALPDALSRVAISHTYAEQATRFIRQLGLRPVKVTQEAYAYSLFL